MSTEAKELDLLGKVEFRIALADTDLKLETLLRTYLCPVLLKLASEHLSVRNKVISICSHISTRIRAPTIQLPVAALLKQFKEQNTPLIRHFDSVYIQQGVPRLSERDLLALLPDLISGVAETLPTNTLQGAQIFHVLLRILQFYRLPPRGSKEDDELRSTLKVSDKDASFLAFWFGKLILFALPGRIPVAGQTGASGSCPGLTAEEFKFLSVHSSDTAWVYSQGGLKLDDSKVMAAKMLNSGIFKDDERFQPGIYASANTNSRVSDIGDDILKRVSIDMDQRSSIEPLYDMYLKMGFAKDIVSLPPGVRIKLMSYLSRSSASASYPNRVIQLVKSELGIADSGPQLAPPQPGREANKLQAALLDFVRSLVQRSKEDDLQKIAIALIIPLQHYIENQGWPVADADQDITSRGHCYELIGLLARASKEADLGLLKWLFASLGQDTSGNIILSIDEALSHTINLFQGVTGDEREQFVDLLLNVSKDARQGSLDTRQSRRLYAAVRFANRCLPFSDVAARKIDTLAIALQGKKDSQDIVSEGKRGLNPASFDLPVGAEEPDFPPFRGLLGALFSDVIHDLDGIPTTSEINTLAQTQPHQFIAAVHFLRLVLYHQALPIEQRPVVDAEWERKLLALLTKDNSRESIKAKIQSIKTDKALLLLLHSAFLLIKMDAAGEQAGFFIELYSLTGDLIPSPAIKSYVQDLEDPILSNNPHIRTIAARAFGLLASQGICSRSGVPEITAQLSRMQRAMDGWQGAVGAQINKASGALLALAYFHSRLARRKFVDQSSLDSPAELLVPTLDMLKNADKTLKEATYQALSQLSMSFVLQPMMVEKHMPYIDAANLIYDGAKAGNEKAITALGRFSMIADEGSDNLKHIVDRIHALHEVKQMEAQFAVGEAFTYAACGWRSKALASELDIDAPLPTGPQRESTLTQIMDKIVEDSKASKPSLRKASVIWLLCVLEYCGHLSAVQERLPQCQQAFKRCLADKDNLVQEAAAKGLGLVYQNGDRELKDALVRDLVGSFSEGKAQLGGGNVTADTELFEAGALPTGEGSSVTTYRDILNLASEVGDSSLVYRFMNMASNNAIWSSRAAFGRFGLSNVLADANVDPKLVPKLFRFKYDPNTNVRRAMNEIWNSMFKDTSATINTHFDAIIEDLLKSIMDGREWRVREASCTALSELVQGRPLEKYEKYLTRVWSQCFKVMDDIKGSVRVAAMSLARVLTGILTRSLEADTGSSKTAEGMLKQVIPFLLSGSGLESSAEDVRMFAIVTLLDIIKKSGPKTLGSFIPDLVERLLGLHSTLEHEAVNYLHLNASKYNTTEQAIDDKRLQAVRMSPITEAIERCLDRMDDATMAATAPRLEQAMKNAIGLPSKVGCSRVLVSLSTRHNLLFRSYADQFLKLIEKVIMDRNETVSSSYASAAGYVARLSSDKQILQTLAFAKKLYFQSEDARSRLIAGDLVYSISKNATDRFANLGSDFLPFVFIGKYDSDEQVHEAFEKTWSENVGGSRSVLLYLKEIIALAQEYLDSPKWVLKHTSARSIAEAVTAVASTIEDINVANAEIIWSALDKAMAGKTWEGKEVVLKAFVRFVERGSPFWKSRSKVATQINKVAVREAKRQNKAYRPFAIRALGQVAAARKDVDMSQTVFDVITPTLEELEGDDPMEVDGDKGVKQDKLLEETASSILLALADAIQPAALEDPDIPKQSATAFNLMSRAEKIISFKPSLRSSIFEAYKTLSSKIANSYPFSHTNEQELLSTMLKTLFNASDANLSEAIRIKRAEAAVAVSKISWSADAKSQLAKTLTGEVEAERSTSVKAELDKARAALA